MAQRTKKTRGHVMYACFINAHAFYRFFVFYFGGRVPLGGCWAGRGGRVIQGIRSDVSAVVLAAGAACCRFDGGTVVPI